MGRGDIAKKYGKIVRDCQVWQSFLVQLIFQNTKGHFENKATDPRLSTMVAIAWALDVQINQMFRVEKL